MKQPLLLFILLPLFIYGQKLKKVKQFYSNGKLYSRGYNKLIKGSEKPIGLWTYWYANGQKELEKKVTKSTIEYINFWTSEGIQLLSNGNGIYTEIRFDEDHPWRGYWDSTIYTIKNYLKEGKYIVYGGVKNAYTKYKAGFYIKGIRQPSDTLFYSNGNLSIVTICEGYKKGCWIKEYREDGHLKREGLFADYAEQGEWLYYSNSGVVENKVSYLEGRMSGAFSEYYRSGKLKEQGLYAVVKKRNENYKQEEKNGGYGLRKYFFNSVKDGEWKYFDEAGKFVRKEVYNKGELVSIEMLN